MKSHDWIFLMFTTIICCTTIITIAQAQQRGRVKFGVSMQKDEVETNNSPEIVSLANQARGSASHRASSRFRAAIPSAIPLTIEENKEPSRSVQRGNRGRANDRSSRKLTAEATEAIPLVRSRKRINPAPTTSSGDQPTKVELPTSSIDRTNVIRRSKTRSESVLSSTSPPTSSSGSIRRRSDVPSDGPSTESVRKVRTYTSRSVTKQTDEVISSENPLTVATTGSNWRNVAMKRGSSKVKSSERKSKALDEDQLEDENYPEHFKLLLRKQQPSAALLPKNYPNLPIQEDQTYSKLNEVYEAPRAQVGRLRRLEQTSQETSDEILQVSRAIPKVNRVELKREDTSRAALKTKRIEPRPEKNIESAIRIEEPPKSRRSDAEKLRAQVKINKAAIKSRKKEPSNEVQREDTQKLPFKSNRRTESSIEDNAPEVKPNEIEESSKASKPLFLPRRAEPYRPKPKTTTQRPTTTSKPIKKPEVLAARTKFKNRFNSRLQFPSLRTKTSSTSDEVIKYDNEVIHTSPAPQPVRPLQITKSRNLALDRPAVDARPKPKQQKFSSRYRGDAFSRYQQKLEPSKPIYTPTIPALTTEPIPPQLDQVTPYNLENHDLNKSGSNFDGIVYDGTAGVWNMVEPVAGGLTRSEISVESVGEEQPLAQSSVTVSIFEALADILSKTPSTTTSTTTTTTTSTTTTSTTELPDIIQVPEQKIDSKSSTTVNTHDPITDVMDDENTSTTTNAITNNDRDGRLLNSVEINQSTTIFTPTTTLPIDTSDSQETITVPQYTSDTTLLLRSQTEQTTPEFNDFTTLSLPALTTQPTFINTNLTNISTNLLELTTLASNPPTSLPMPFLADALTTPGSSLITRPQLISAISNFLDTSVQNASDTMATTTENTTETTTATLDTNSTPTDVSTTLSPPITTTFSPPSTGSPPVTISFLDLFTIQAKKVNQNTEPAVEVHPIYKGPESTTTPVGVEKKQTTGRPVNINTFFGTQTYPSISITGSTSTDRTLELSSTFSENPKVTGGETTDTPIPTTTTLEQDTSTLDYTTSPQSSIRTQSLPIHLNSILGSTQKYDQTSPFKTVQTEITTTIRSRFGNRRIPILPAGSVQSTTNKISTTTQTSSTTTKPVSPTTTVTLVSPENNQQQLSNVTSTTSSTTTITEQKPIQDFSVYGILPNNTVVRKRPPQLSRQLDIGIMVYGILPNQTVVRKYPNGTLMIVDSSKDVEVVDIDPKMLFNPFSELYRTSQSSLLLTTHRSTTSHRLIESNHILSSSSSSSSTEVPNNFATGSGRRGNSIKETTESGNTDSALSTNTDDENLIQWLSENEDNILNSTILFESNTENAVLLDLLKRKYIKADLPSRSSNVVSLTTVRNVIEENSIPANKEEDVSENTLFDSSEEKKKDTIDDFFLSKGSVVPNRINNNNDDENVISKQFDTSYANVGIGSIFAGNKEPKQVDRQTTPTIYLVTPASMMTTTEIPATPTLTIPSTTTPTSTTPSTTTTSTTPSTTTTSSTTQSTTTSTTTPIATTTSTTTTPIPIILETTTTPKPTIVFKAPSTTSGTILNSQSPPQTNTALNDANNSELEKNIKLLEQLLQLQASLKPKPSSSSTTTTSTPSTTTTTRKATEAPTKIIAGSSANDEQFINQLRQLLLIQQQATKKPTTTTTTTTPKPTTTTTTTSTTTTRKPITISPQNLQDLLNSFSTPSFTTTTAKPIPNVNDIEFLNSLREIGKIQVTTSAPTTFANRIIELALKNRPVKPTSPVYISTTVPPFVPMPEVKFPQILPSNEVEKHHQDQASLSADLSLLSTLLGRRITVADLPQITQQFGGNRVKPAFAPVPGPAPRKTTTSTTTPRTTRRTTTTTSTERPMTRDEIAEIEKNLNLLSSLLGRPVSLNELPLIMQELRSGRKPKGNAASGATINFITPAPFKTTTTVRPRPDVSLPSQTPISQEEVIELLKDPSIGSPEQLNIYGQSNDAILAAVLKQRGIGPAHNNLPINDLFGQEQTQRPYRPTRPPPPPPPPQRRPVLDGLAWLWRTWQETAAPGNRVSKSNRQPTASASTRLESPLLVGAYGGGEAPTPTVNSNEGGEYADLQYPQNPSFGQGNGLLTAAFGVTRAVSQFLGAAFQGAAKSVQSAFSPQAIQQPSLISLSG